MLTKIMKVFASEKNNTTTLCFKLQDRFVLFKHNLAVEIDGKGHKDRDEHKETERENAIKHLLIVSLLVSVLIKRILIFLLILVKYIITLKNHSKDL